VTNQPLAERAVNTLRFLSADAVQNANSGHPGLPMGAAPMAYVLWSKFLRHSPANPHWADRDRFILSAGHGSALLYALLHLTGYALSLDEVRAFRQYGSLTPGHPESHLTPGVETTTGPLGQGLSNSVGFAIAEAHLAARYNRPGHDIINHYTYVLASDGDLQEGVTGEASSLAGHLGLGKLIVLYDDNRIQLGGTTSLSFTEDVSLRYAAYGWQVQRVSDGNDLVALEKALHNARTEPSRPSLIIVQTTIGFGAPHKQGTFEAHGSPLGPEELKAAKDNLGWPEAMFHLPEDMLNHFRSAIERGKKLEADWNAHWEKYAKAHPDLAAELKRRLAGELPPNWEAQLPSWDADPKGLATRKASESVLNALGKVLPELMGGSADLNPSTFTVLKGAGDFQSPYTSAEGAQGTSGGAWGYEGRNLHFGVREHAMGSIVNGLTLHGGVIGYGSTFLTFFDYMRPAVRLSAIMKIGPLWIYTHDSVGVGEDGPTHQPVEHYAAARAIPDLLFIRPGDANEVTWAYKVAIENRHRPTILSLTRQNLPVLDRAVYASTEGVAKGAYVLNPQVTDPQLILIATGSELSLIVEAEKKLAEQGVRARLVSMPCWELFEEQSAEYRESVLPASVTARLAVEAGVELGWHKWVGMQGDTLTLNRYGASAPAARVFKELGFTVENVVATALRVLGK
jgi:transketolase